MLFIRKLKKNKIAVLSICVGLICLLYFGAQNVIDDYIFGSNSDIATEDTDLSNGVENEAGESELEEEGIGDGVREDGQILEEEVDLVLEDFEGDGAEGMEATAGDVEADGKSVSESDDVAFQTENLLKESKIYVYITGEVISPGVLMLNEGSRIVDAINAAGGTTAKANVSKVNLVYVLEDGMKVNIPNSNDLKNNPDFEYITMNSGDGASDSYSSSSSGNGSESEAIRGGSDSRNSSRYDVVNINTATQTELESLPGIGPSLALKIINYRKENGKFSSIEDIKNVSGIGESKFEELRRYITV